MKINPHTRSKRSPTWGVRTDVSNLPPIEGAGYIPLTQGKYAIVDTEDFERVNGFKWQYSNGYATRSKKHTPVQMTRFILNFTDPAYEIDHENRKSLDNRKQNLRICTPGQNGMNKSAHSDVKSKYKGVSKYCYKTGNILWCARVTYKGKLHMAKYFKTEEEAARAYDEKAKELFGEFACLNFPHSVKENIL